MIFPVSRWRLLGLAASVALTGCVIIGSGKPHLESASELGTDEVVLVGRIELIPPLKNFEQELHELGSDRRSRGKGFAVFTEQLSEPVVFGGRHMVLFEFGKDFYVRQRRVPLMYYRGTMVEMKRTGREASYMDLPGLLKYPLQPGDGAVYVGTIRLYRDDYNEAKKIEIIDDYDRANRDFTKKFGQRLKLRRVVPQKIN